MTTPDHTETIRDGGMGFSGPDVDDVLAVVGASSSGTPNQVYGFTNPQDAIDTLGDGPGVEALVHHLSIRKGLCLFVTPTLSVAGATSAVTLSGTGPSPGVTISAGTPRDSYAWKVKIKKGGVVGTSTFSYSLDGGDTWSGDIATAATYVVPHTGITLGFTAGTYVKDDVYSATSTAPMYSTTNFGTAFDALITDGRAFSMLHQVGSPGGATDADKATAWAGFASAVQTKLATAFSTNHKPLRAFLDAADIADDSSGDTLIAAAFLAVVAERVCTFAGFCELESLVTPGAVYKRPAMWPAVGRARNVKPGRDPARVCGNQSTFEPLPYVRSLYHDEDKRGTLDAMRLGTLRTFADQNPQGFYITNAPLLSATGSDFVYVQHGRVMDMACRVVRPEMLKVLSDELRTYPSPAPSGKVAGAIVEQDALDIDARVSKKLNAKVIATQNAVRATVAVVRDDVLTNPDSKLRTKVRVKPYFYPKVLETELGFEP